MAFPNAPTEGAGAKVHFLTTTGNAAAGWAAIDTATSDSGGNTLGFAAVATHVEGDAVGAPGGIDTTSVPCVLVAGDNGTNAVPLQLSGTDLKITLDSETVVLGTGTAAFGKLAANSGVDIGDVDVTSVAGTVTVDNGGTFAVQEDGAVLTALQLLDNTVDGNYLDVNANIAGTDMVGGAGAVAAGVQRITLASDDPAVAKLGTIDTDTGAMATSLGNLDNAVDGNYLNVNANVAGTDIVGGAGAVAAGVQRTTLASDDPAVALLGTIDADTGAIKTAVELLDNAVSGSELQVDVVAALPAGTNAIGKLAANSGVDIGDVTLTAGTNAFGKLAANSGVDIGDVDVTSVPAPLSTTGGGTEAAALRVTVATDSTGVLSVDDNAGALTVDWAGTAPPIGAGTEAAALRVTLATDSTGVVSIDDNGGALSIDDGGNTITVDGNIGDNGPGFTAIHKYLAKATTADATLWDPTANYLYVTDVIISISGTATDVTLGFGAGTDLEETFLKFHGDVRGGLTHHFRAPIKSTDSGDNLNIALSAAQAMTITICGYEAAT